MDEWLAEMEREHGPVPPETLDRAAKLVADLAGGAVIATTDEADLRRLAAYATKVVIADVG